MDSFELHRSVISNYRDYIHSFLNIKDKRIKQVVEDYFNDGGFIPEPLIQFNPSFEIGETLHDLVAANQVHTDLPKIFGDYNLYRHQMEAVKVGIEGKGFVVTSGTGSGKSLTYLATIFNSLLSDSSSSQKGIKAILVYPMNALINSQEEEIKKYEINYLKSFCPADVNIPKDKTSDEIISFLEEHTNKRFPISYAKYTGQEGLQFRDYLKKNCPDIILTNYMMLELIMTRQSENWMRQSFVESLKYLVYDELHTYRGRQGADVSLLIRRIKKLARNNIICIGTSATMASAGSKKDKQKAVANVAEIIFGSKYEIGQIIVEYLKTCTNFDLSMPTKTELSEAIKNGIEINNDEENFFTNPISRWLERNIALNIHSNDFIERGKPIRLSEIVNLLHKESQVKKEETEKVLRKLLQWTEALNKKAVKNKTGKSYLPFKHHQFISQTNTIHITLDKKEERKISIKTGRYILEGDGNKEKFLYPVLFSRYSGYEFICVQKDTEAHILKPREPDYIPKTLTRKESSNIKLSESDFPYGYILIPNEDEEFWNKEEEKNLPDGWFKKLKSGDVLEPYYQYQIPQKIYFNSKGNYSNEAQKDYLCGWFISAKLRIDPTAGIVYEDPKTNDNTKLMRLGNEGRSTATTLIAYSVIDSLHNQQQSINNQKLLSFTDNRQDASLQAGHFNDFLSSIRLRSAVYHALVSNPDGIKVYDIAHRTFEQLKLEEKEYARNPNEEWTDQENERALKEYLLIRILYDLKRGWRYILPNLEQCALLDINYYRLEEFCKRNDFFKNLILFNSIEPEERVEIIRQILDFFRSSFAINYPSIFEKQGEIKSLIQDKLDSNKLWSLDKQERIDTPYTMVSKNPGKTYKVFTASIGISSNLEKYINRLLKERNMSKLKGEDYIDYINELCDTLVKGNFLSKQEVKGDKGTVFGYQLRTDMILWKPGDEQNIRPDNVRMSTYQDLDIHPNEFFKKLYKFDFTSYNKPIIGREHTGQVSNEDRIKRENEFRKGIISSLFCSPTMELGIDIANLDIVHMRNVPPNPANYAQRSGRAGRSGQSAIVFTYCSSISPHDRTYFESSEKMIAGVVNPPRIDLKNEELIRTHLNAYILMELEIQAISISVADLLDLKNYPQMPIKPDIIAHIEDQLEQNKVNWIQNFHEIIKEIEPGLSETFWFTPKWIEGQYNTFYKRFDSSMDRWRILYRNAVKMIEKSRMVMDDPTIKIGSKEHQDASRQEWAGKKQRELLLNNRQQTFGNNSEFYIFRYLASEGFLPGYNFTRLPVRAFLGYKHNQQGEYVSRPRFLALTEFGPNNLIYHDGSKYGISRIALLDHENATRTIKISKTTGYACIDGQVKLMNNDPITKEVLKGTDNAEVCHRLLEINESDGIPKARISCEEEERTKQGFEVDQYFNYPKGIDSTVQTVIKSGDTPLLNVIYGPSTELIKINGRWKRSQDSNGFHVDLSNGKWLRQKDLENPDVRERSQEVKLFARDTADTIYIQPMKELDIDEDQITTLSYALKKAIENVFEAEENEINVWLMGKKDAPNIMIYEASEGSLGILSQLIKSPKLFKDVFIEAYRIIHYDPDTKEDTKPELPKANYEDLLSYYNQIHHDKIDRHSIKEALEKLMEYDIEPITEKGNRQQHYQYLLDNYDKNSSTELPLIKFLYENGYALPDIAQMNMKDYYISVDFVYKTDNGPVLIFCDGNVHDEIELKKKDEHKRQLLREAGFDVIEWHYTEKIEDLVKRRKDIFRKIY